MWNTRLLSCCLGLCAAALPGHGQVAPPPSGLARSFYFGAEATFFANQLTQFTQRYEHLAAESSNLVLAPALLAGCQLSARWAVEVRVQDLPVLTGYQYQRETATDYLGFGQSYTQDYLYVPVQAAWRALGRHSRLSLSLLAGGGPAWTDTRESFITPNGTQQFYSSGGGSIGSGPSAPVGTAVTATVTQQLTRQQGFFVGLEAGVRGTWRVLPHLALDLTARQLWSTTPSARDLDLTIQTPSDYLQTTLRTPVRGVCAGLGVRYLL